MLTGGRTRLPRGEELDTVPVSSYETAPVSNGHNDFSFFGLGLWLKFGSPSVCPGCGLMGFYLLGHSRGKQKGALI